jgi:hypothetical protein
MTEIFRKLGALFHGEGAAGPWCRGPADVLDAEFLLVCTGNPENWTLEIQGARYTLMETLSRRHPHTGRGRGRRRRRSRPDAGRDRRARGRTGAAIERGRPPLPPPSPIDHRPGSGAWRGASGSAGSGSTGGSTASRTTRGC